MIGKVVNKKADCNGHYQHFDQDIFPYIEIANFEYDRTNNKRLQNHKKEKTWNAWVQPYISRELIDMIDKEGPFESPLECLAACKIAHSVLCMWPSKRL